MSYDKLIPVAGDIVKAGSNLAGHIFSNQTARQELCLKYGVAGLALVTVPLAVCYVANKFFETEQCAIKNGQETSFGFQKDGTDISAAYSTKKY